MPRVECVHRGAPRRHQGTALSAFSPTKDGRGQADRLDLATNGRCAPATGPWCLNPHGTCSAVCSRPAGPGSGHGGARRVPALPSPPKCRPLDRGKKGLSGNAHSSAKNPVHRALTLTRPRRAVNTGLDGGKAQRIVTRPMSSHSSLRPRGSGDTVYVPGAFPGLRAASLWGTSPCRSSVFHTQRLHSAPSFLLLSFILSE